MSMQIMEGQPATLGTLAAAATGIVGATQFGYVSSTGRKTLAIAAMQNGGNGSTISAQLQASLDGVNFVNVGSALTLGGSSAANAQTVNVDGFMGAVLQLNVTTFTAGAGVTSATFTLLLG